MTWTGWALDLGTTNSGVACWDEATGKPRLVELPAVCRKLDAKDPLEAPRLVPSAVHFLEKPGLVDRLGSWPPLARRFFMGRRALIGRQALERNEGVAPGRGACQFEKAPRRVERFLSRPWASEPRNDWLTAAHRAFCFLPDRPEIIRRRSEDTVLINRRRGSAILGSGEVSFGGRVSEVTLF
jgi:hypothetical protein